MIRFFMMAGALFLILKLFQLPWVKGKVAEWMFARFIRFQLPKDTYHILNDIALRLPDGSTTQIDHIIVSRYGIFVIELKNYQGWIFGDPNAPNWTQVFGPKRKYPFQNPLRQNYRHIKALAELTEIPENLFISVIAFVGGCTLKTRDKLPPHVVYTGGAAAYIRSHKETRIPDNQVMEMYETIRSWNTHSNVSNREHIDNIKRRKQSTEPEKESGSILRLSAILFFVGLAAFVLLRKDTQPSYHRELNSVLNEVTILTNAHQNALKTAQYIADRNTLLENVNQRLSQEADDLRTRVQKLTIELTTMTDQLLEANHRASTAEAELERIVTGRRLANQEAEEMRKQQLAAIAAANRPANQPPFRVFDVIHVGQKNIRGLMVEAGRFSVRNYTDQPLMVSAAGTSFTIPPNNASNSVWVQAKKGSTLTVEANGHTEQHRW